MWHASIFDAPINELLKLTQQLSKTFNLIGLLAGNYICLHFFGIRQLAIMHPQHWKYGGKVLTTQLWVENKVQ